MYKRQAVYKPEELDILRLGLDTDLYPNVDWMDMLLKDGAWSNRINLNMSGGGTTARYFVSASYVKEDGMYNTCLLYTSERSLLHNHGTLPPVSVHLYWL